MSFDESSDLKILIIEDEKSSSSNSNILLLLLSKIKKEFPGAVIIIQSSIKKALDSLGILPRPDVAIINLHLDNFSISDTIDQIKLLHENTPVVVLNSSFSTEIQENLEKAGSKVINYGSVNETNLHDIILTIINTISFWRKDWWIKVERERARTDSNLTKLRNLIHGNGTE